MKCHCFYFSFFFFLVTTLNEFWAENPGQEDLHILASWHGSQGFGGQGSHLFRDFLVVQRLESTSQCRGCEFNPWDSTTEPPGKPNFAFYFVLFILFFKINLFIWLHEVLVTAHGILFPDQGLNPGPLHWKHRVSATEPPGKSLVLVIKTFNLHFRSLYVTMLWQFRAATPWNMPYPHQFLTLQSCLKWSSPAPKTL